MSFAKEQVKPIRDFVYIKKRTDLEQAEKFGSIIIPESTNLTIRQLKVGEVLSTGAGGVTEKGVFVPCEILPGSLVYYTRWEKTFFQDDDNDMMILCRDPGVLAYVDFTEAGRVIRPRHDNLVIGRLPDDEITKSGIIIPDWAREMRKEAGPGHGKFRYSPYRVLAAGPGRITKKGKRVPCDIEPGQVVWCSKYSGFHTSWVHTDELGTRIMHVQVVQERECPGRILGYDDSTQSSNWIDLLRYEFEQPEF